LLRGRFVGGHLWCVVSLKKCPMCLICFLTKLKKRVKKDKKTQNRPQVHFGRLPMATYRL